MQLLEHSKNVNRNSVSKRKTNFSVVDFWEESRYNSIEILI